MANSISPSASLADSVKTLGSCEIGEKTRIEDYSIIGYPNAYPDTFESESDRIVKIGANCQIHPWALIYEGAHLDNNIEVGERCMVGSRTHIGSYSRIYYGAQIHDDIVIGEKCIIAGFIADNTKVGKHCHIFGSLIHKYSKPNIDNYDEIDEPGPLLEDDVIVGWGAVIIGNVSIGRKARIRPNAVVREDIPPGKRYGSR